MQNKTFLYCFLFAFLCWTIPFIVRIAFVEMPTTMPQTPPKQGRAVNRQSAAERTIQFLVDGDKHGAFISIFTNNTKGCLLNMAGGVFLGLGTLINGVFNGFFMADSFSTTYKSDINMHNILKVTLPHSFELLGFWLSAAIGFLLAWNIILFIRGKECFTRSFYRIVGVSILLTLFITLAAAYVEAYISTSFIPNL